MRKVIILALWAAATCAFAEPWVGRIPITGADDIQALQGIALAIYGDEEPGYLDLVLDQRALDHLSQMGYAVEALTPLPTRETDLIDPEYHTYEELTSELQNLENLYPTLCKVDSIGRATQFPRTMWAVKLSDNATVEEDEIAVFYFGTHHACEIMGCETLLYMINHFLQNYGSDPQITQWMNNYEIWFVPLVNPDGQHAVTSNIDLFWRKNARDIDGDGIYYEFVGGTWWTDDHEGIDLNRNYNWYWNLDGSTDPWNYYYRGTAPFSESENVALKILAYAQRFTAGISFHSYGDVVIAPWTWPGGLYAPDQDVINSIGNGLASRFLMDNGAQFSYTIYPGQSGRCPNWFYGQAGAIAYDIELCPYPTFIPPGSQLAERTNRYMNGATYLLERLAGPGITGHVKSAVTGQPLEARVEIQGRISTQVKARLSEPLYGRFTRLLNNGTYTVLAALPGYATARIQNVVVNNGLTPVEIQLQPTDQILEQPLAVQRAPFTVRQTQVTGDQISLTFELEQPMQLTLTLHDVMGRQVAQVFDGYREAGTQRMDLSSVQLPSGVYFARLAGAGWAQTVKVVVMR